MLVLSCASEEDKAKVLYEKAMQFDGEKKHAEAIEVYYQILAEYPQFSSTQSVKENLMFDEALLEMSRRAKARLAMDALKVLAKACEKYFKRNQQYPESLEALLPDYLGEISLDPWGFPYNYRVEPDPETAKAHQKYFLASFGSDGIPGGEEDEFDLIVKDGEFYQIHEWLR